MQDRKEQQKQEVVEASPSESLSLIGSAKDIMARYSHCMICGGNLHFTHLTDFSRNLTQEIAKCPECGVRARNVTHRLQ